jgi:hypothetical protein
VSRSSPDLSLVSNSTISSSSNLGIDYVLVRRSKYGTGDVSGRVSRSSRKQARVTWILSREESRLNSGLIESYRNQSRIEGSIRTKESVRRMGTLSI